MTRREAAFGGPDPRDATIAASDSVRLFVALALPPTVRAALDDARAPLRSTAGRALAFTAAERLHLTLRFLGERLPALVDPLARHLAVAVADHPPVTLALAAAGAFPGWRHPRVLWIGLAPNSALDRLYHSVDSACAAAGLGHEGRPFRPHLTLARVRPGARCEPSALAEAAGRVTAALAAVPPFSVPTVDLMASQLTRDCARHTRLAALALRGATALGATAPEGR